MCVSNAPVIVEPLAFLLGTLLLGHLEFSPLLFFLSFSELSA